MSDNTVMNPAEHAAKEASDQIIKCIDQHSSFLVEAGAGAGKTYSLISVLRYVVQKQGKELLRRNQRVACITYTNVACDEIRTRTDRHPVIHSDTIHAFCWSLVKQFQPILRKELPKLKDWAARLDEVGGIGSRVVDYNLGYANVEDDRVLLHHNDVLSLTVALLEQPKFRTLLTCRYPILLIDEYQDTDKMVADALSKHFLSDKKGPLIGFFGDHWQMIYGSGCGKIDHPKLEIIGKHANFRSVPAIVEVLNRIRPDLQQYVTDPTAKGFVAVFHTNQWAGTRLTGSHWEGNLPPDECHRYLETVTKRLSIEGWDFTSPNESKILMLTHRVLATEQGYANLLSVFPYHDALIKKEDPYIAFFLDRLEPICAAYENKRYGEMFAAGAGHLPVIRTHADKTRWANNIDELLRKREKGTIGDVLDYLKKTDLRIPNAIERKERVGEKTGENVSVEDAEMAEQRRKFRCVEYQEVVALAKFVEGHTPFSTKHGVKGAEFENVLVVVGRGWNVYDFNRMLEWAGTRVPLDKLDSFERNRNLFYVACSRPKKRLALLFTQRLSNQALSTLGKWFGNDAIFAL